MRCERCSRDVYKYVVCNYCNKKIGNECMKSSKRKTKAVRLIICKDCWSIMSKRKEYKSAVNVSAAQQQQQRPYSY
jgi:uncharacterized CHY-type Zn-finger protein